ncbi:MAG: hypothetical protein VYE15_02110, partial [Myxococcota bacterium]|nr:hypothetical protein [Myxococcota bacterium]
GTWVEIQVEDGEEFEAVDLDESTMETASEALTDVLQQSLTRWMDQHQGMPDAIEEMRSELRQLQQDMALWRQCTPERDPHVRGLVAAGVEATIAAAIVERARRRAMPREGLGIARAPDLGAELVEALPVAPPIWGREGRVVAALVGPTGVGKTRTAAKLAGLGSFVHNRRVAILTTDVHRMGGDEPLRSYCRELGVPFKKVRTASELRHQLGSLRSRDVILVDTPGCSPWDEGTLEYVNELLVDMERHLVVPATRDAEQVRQAALLFGAQRLQSVIVTKLDEARGPGSVLSATWGSGVPISHICTGQTVPDDCSAVTDGTLHTGILAQAA